MNSSAGRRGSDAVKILYWWLVVFVVVVLACPSFGQERVKFPVAVGSKVLGFAPLWVAAKQGFFDRQVLDVQLVLVRGTETAVQALAGGSAYVAIPSPDLVIGSVERGLGLVMIGGLVNGLTHAIMGGKKYRTYEDLRGTLIGSQTLSSGITFVLRRVLKAKGLEYPRDYKLISFAGGGPEIFAALSAGQIAAAPLAPPLNFAVEESGFNLIGWYRDVLPNYQLNVYVVERSWAEKNRPLLVRFMKAIVLAKRWLYENKEPAIDLLGKELKLKPGHARKGWEYYTENRIWHPDADINMEGLQIAMQVYGEQFQAKGPLPSPARYVDQSYLKEALRELGGR